MSARSAGAPESGVLQKAKLKFSSPSRTAQRPFQGRWLVLLDPNWFQQSHHATTYRRRTAASGTTEFQIRPDNQLQRKYPPPELIGHRKKAIEGDTGQLCKLTLICNTQQVDAGLLSAAVRLTRAAGSSTEGSPRADCKSLRNIKDSHAETPKSTMRKRRSKPRRSRPQAV